MRPSLNVPSISRRARIIISIVAALILLFSFLGTFVSIYVDWLWYGETGYRNVYTTQLQTRALLFVLFGLFMAVVVAGNMWLAYRLRPPFRPMSTEQQNLERYRTTIEPRRKLWLVLVGALVGIFTGAYAQGRWQVWQLWRNGQEFGINDPQFHKDISYFVFTYPFQRLVLNILFVAIVLAFIVAAIVHYLFGALRLQTPGEKVTPAARAHLSVLLGVFVLLKAVAYYLDRYGLAFSERGQVTGASYTDINAVLPAKAILMVIAVLCAVAFFANVFFRNFQLPAIALALLVLSSVLIGGAYPALIQQFQVRPNADQREEPYIERNIEATRQAYGINNVDYIDYPAATDLSDAARTAIRDDANTIPNARLLDPNVLAPTYDQLQRISNIYGFPEKLDIDRYTINGETQDYVVGVRELDPSQLQDNQTNWINRHLVYTHGNGFVSAPANQVTEQGQPNFNSFDIPTQGDIEVTQPRIYYGELSGDTYTIVGKEEGEENREFDAPMESGEEKNTYDGEGGVEIGNLVNRLAFAAYYRERNILFSGAISEDSRIQYIRDPRERVEKVAPFVTADGDPYPVVIEGRIVWIVDGYTSTDRYPYAQRATLGDITIDSQTGEGTAEQPENQINYIRNSVKATVDAYDGTVRLYQFGERDPVLEAWRSIFPDVVRPQSEISEELRAHFRYPEDLFKVQRDLLARYHVDDPIQFFNAQNFWDVPDDPTRPGQDAIPPYFITGKIPGQDQATFQLTSAFNALERPNMAAFMSASSDPQDYGQLRVLRLPTSTTQPGPSQAQGQISSSTEVATEVSLLDQRGSNVIFGNLLTLPVGDGLVYVEPVYVQAQGQAFPLLRRVVASFGDRVAYENTLAEALDVLFGEGAGQQAPDEGRPTQLPPEGEQPAPPTPPSPQQPGLSPELSQAVADIQTALDALQQAQRDGNFEAIGRAQADLQRATEAFEAAQQGDNSGGSPSPSPGG